MKNSFAKKNLTTWQLDNLLRCTHGSPLRSHNFCYSLFWFRLQMPVVTTDQEGGRHQQSVGSLGEGDDPQVPPWPGVVQITVCKGAMVRGQTLVGKAMDEGVVKKGTRFKN